MLIPLRDGWDVFASTWSAQVGLPVWFVVALVAAGCFVARALRVAFGDGRELVRRRRILERLRHGIPAALERNEGLLQEVREECLRLRVLRWVSAEPVECVAQQHGIGPGTVARLRDAGFVTLGDLLERSPRTYLVGTARAGAALAFVRWLLQHRLDAARADPRCLPPDPEIERLLLDAEARISDRRGELEEDAGGLDTLQETVDAFEDLCKDTSAADRLNAWIWSWADPPRWDRVTSLVGAALGVVLLPALLPLTLAFADPELGARAGAASFLIALISACTLAVSFYVMGDGVRLLGRLHPQPVSFAEQRLEAVAARLALQLGIAPPDVYVVNDDVPNAAAAGRPQGPSFVLVHTGLLQRLEPIEVHAVLAHELGHLAGDDSRIGAAARRASAPLVWMGDLAVAAGLHLVAWGFWRPATRFTAGSFGLTAATWLATPLLALWLVVAGPLVAIRLVAAELSALVSHRKEYDADAVSARLLGAEPLSRALEVLLDLEQGTTEAPPTVRQILFSTPPEVGPVLRLRLIVDGWVAWLSGTHPPLETRIRALHQPVLAEQSAVLSMGRAVAVVLTAIVLSGNLAGAAVDAVGADNVGVERDLSMPPPPPAIGRSATVWTELGACTVRAGASTESEPLGFPPNGTCCDIQEERGRWRDVRCGAIVGWIHASCLRPERSARCDDRG